MRKSRSITSKKHTKTLLRISRRSATIIGVSLVVLALAVLIARLVWSTSPVESFVAKYPGVATGAQNPGTPLWVVALHTLNIFFMVLIAKSGLLIRYSRKPIAHWQPSSRRKTGGNGRKRPQTITVEQWFHVAIDCLWMVCGLLFIVLLFSTGRWVRLAPTNWDVFPNALSVVLQYLSFHWPAEDTWVAYNALQMLAYFSVIFILAPLAALSGLRQSFLWPRSSWAGRIFPLAWCRPLHLVVAVSFGIFVVCHVAMVFLTGAMTNLSHMFAGSNTETPIALIMLCLVVIGAGLLWWGTKPIIITSLAQLFGKVTR